MYCDVCGQKAVVEINFNGNRTYGYCFKHNRMKGQDWIVCKQWTKTKEGKPYEKIIEFHPQSVRRL